MNRRETLKHLSWAPLALAQLRWPLGLSPLPPVRLDAGAPDAAPRALLAAPPLLRQAQRHLDALHGASAPLKGRVGAHAQPIELTLRCGPAFRLTAHAAPGRRALYAATEDPPSPPQSQGEESLLPSAPVREALHLLFGAGPLTAALHRWQIAPRVHALELLDARPCYRLGAAAPHSAALWIDSHSFGVRRLRWPPEDLTLDLTEWRNPVASGAFPLRIRAHLRGALQLDVWLRGPLEAAP